MDQDPPHLIAADHCTWWGILPAYANTMNYCLYDSEPTIAECETRTRIVISLTNPNDHDGFTGR